MNASNKAVQMALRAGFSYVEKDPEKRLKKIIDLVDRFAPAGEKGFPVQRAAFRKFIEDKDNNMHKLILRLFEETDPDVLSAIFDNFIVNGNLVGWPMQNENMEKYGCNIPWAILMDPTSACNLHCTGCWAAEYGNKLNLSFDELDSVITQGKELGCYIYIYTGGEPLVRKDDILKLCRKHNDCQFLCFTNATLIDEDFANAMLEVKNFMPAISLEGFEMATDGRRGQGVYQKVIKAMSLLKEKRLPFGISACYTSANVDSIASEEFMDQIIDLGAAFIWYFHYMPIGNDAAPELLPNPEQREYMFHRIREIRETKAIFPMDFQNDGEFVQGCIAGGRRYFHINANGDCDPCVFIHYSNANIRKNTLLEVLKSPIFMAYHDGQPFNDNHLRPCPMLENPQLLKEMVEKTGAHSTDLQSPESVEHLCEKCELYAEHWKPMSEKLWAARQQEKAEQQAAARKAVGLDQ